MFILISLPSNSFLNLPVISVSKKIPLNLVIVLISRDSRAIYWKEKHFNFS